MAASYKKLFKLLIDRDMKKKELAEKAGISIAAITKMGKDGAVVSSDVLVKIFYPRRRGKNIYNVCFFV